MPYINYDTNGNITEQFGCKQYDGQLYTELDIDSRYKVIDGWVVDISNAPEYIASQKAITKKNITNVYQAKFEELKSSYLAKIGLGTSSEEAYRAQYQALRTALITELANV